MLRGELAGQAFSLTWRFMICFMVLSYPVFSQMMSTIKTMSESPDTINNMDMFLFLIMNVVIPFVIPYFAMYGALLWITSGRSNVKT